MPGTELETQTWIKLTLIAERARQEPQCQFTSLAHLLDEGFLAACYRRLGRDRASGVDGVTWQEYGEHLSENVRDLVARLKAVRNLLPVKEWWPVLKAKLLGHYQYYGVSGNMRGIARFYRHTLRLVLKWLNRRSQCKSFAWAGFNTYLGHYPLPKPRIVHNLYTLSPAT
jgi:hypothetical protein